MDECDLKDPLTSPNGDPSFQRNASGTPTSASRWTRTAMWCPPWTWRRRSWWPGWSSATRRPPKRSR